MNKDAIKKNKRLAIERGAGIEPANAPTPNTRAVLVITDPNAFPRAKSEVPFRTATIEVDNSGRDVPIETMVAPISI